MPVHSTANNWSVLYSISNEEIWSDAWLWCLTVPPSSSLLHSIHTLGAVDHWYGSCQIWLYYWIRCECRCVLYILFFHNADARTNMAIVKAELPLIHPFFQTTIMWDSLQYNLSIKIHQPKVYTRFSISHVSKDNHTRALLLSLEQLAQHKRNNCRTWMIKEDHIIIISLHQEESRPIENITFLPETKRTATPSQKYNTTKHWCGGASLNPKLKQPLLSRTPGRQIQCLLCPFPSSSGEECCGCSATHRHSQW